MILDSFRLDGRTALVTGGNRGLGQACARALAEAGAAVTVLGRKPPTFDTDFVACDLATATPADLAAAVDEVRPDILVNNAGVIRRADAVDFTEKDWDEVIDVNLKALFFLSQAFARAAFAREAGGAIVNIASLLAFQGGIRIPSYTASKHGVAGLTKLLANEWAAKGINVNAIAPGYIETNNTEALRADPVRSAAILDRIPAGRWGEASDIAGAAVFLASPAARYVHGAILPVDGGWLAR
jgi:2-deoxy-D-gluconate 3-dehydrogenase